MIIKAINKEMILDLGGIFVEAGSEYNSSKKFVIVGKTDGIQPVILDEFDTEEECERYIDICSNWLNAINCQKLHERVIHPGKTPLKYAK